MKNCISKGNPVPEELIDALKESSDLLAPDPIEGKLKSRLEEDGYLFLAGALDRSEVLAARAEIFDRLARVGEVSGTPANGIFSGRSQRREKHEDLGAFWKSVSEGADIRRVTHGPRLRDIMGTVFGEPARPHDYIFVRPGPVGRSTDLHYDHPFFARGSERILTVWIALGDVPVEDGPLLVVEGSNQFSDLVTESNSRDYDSKGASRVTLDDSPVILAQERNARLCTANFEPGDLTIFTMTTLHGTLDNHSPQGRIRLSCDVRFQPVADPTDIRYFGANPGGTTGIGYGELNGAKPLTEPWHTR